ncbi:MAG: hypothetical protein ACK53Y_25520 [bacterium]|jgi:hypothetical protein
MPKHDIKNLKKDSETWLENEGILLTDFQAQKVALTFMLAERVSL